MGVCSGGDLVAESAMRRTSLNKSTLGAAAGSCLDLPREARKAVEMNGSEGVNVADPFQEGNGVKPACLP